MVSLTQMPRRGGPGDSSFGAAAAQGGLVSEPALDTHLAAQRPLAPDCEDPRESTHIGFTVWEDGTVTPLNGRISPVDESCPGE